MKQPEQSWAEKEALLEALSAGLGMLQLFLASKGKSLGSVPATPAG